MTSIVAADEMRKLLTIKQAAEILSISPKHLRQEFVNTGLIQVVSMGKGCKGDRIELSAINSLIQSRGVLRCLSTREVKSGGSNSRLEAKRYVNPLGPPAKGRLKRQSEKSAVA